MINTFCRFLRWIAPASIDRTRLPTIFLASCLFLSTGCSTAHSEILQPHEITIPGQADWVDCGRIFSAGTEGEWDLYLWGGFATTVIKKDGIFYLYYQGANGYDDNEGTVTYRAIGVATSTDGINFTKYAGNPVLTWFPNDNLEEGAVSGGAFLDENGDITIYYGANRWIGGSQVNADGRLATSSDGFTFTDLGVVLNHSNSSVWGFGDELFPIIGFEDNGRWFTYYIPNGVMQQGRLGAAWGNGSTNLPNSSAARSGNSGILAWGAGSYAKVDSDLYALFINNIRDANGPTLTAYTVALNNPASLSAPIQSYQFDDAVQGIVFLDEEKDTWFMYYRHSNLESYGAKVAGTNGQPISCPTAHQIHLPLIARGGVTEGQANCAQSSGMR
jgi:hypothetical protein